MTKDEFQDRAAQGKKDETGKTTTAATVSQFTGPKVTGPKPPAPRAPAPRPSFAMPVMQVAMNIKPFPAAVPTPVVVKDALHSGEDNKEN